MSKWLSFRKQSQPVPQFPIVGPNWGIYDYTYGDAMAAVVSFDGDAADEAEHLAYGSGRRIIIKLPLDRVGESGLPHFDLKESIQTTERSLLTVLEQQKILCRLVGRMTYSAMVDLVFQVEQTREFDAAIKGWHPTITEFGVDIRESKGWSFFDERVRPTARFRQKLADKLLIATLIEQGCELSTIYTLDHAFLGPASALKQLEEMLRAEGFAVEAPTEGTLIGRIASRLEIEEIWKWTGRFAEFCPQIGVRYDGWGTSITTDDLS